MTDTLPEMITQMDADLTAIAAAEHDLARGLEHYRNQTVRGGHASAEAREIAERDHLPAFRQVEEALVQAGDQAARNGRSVLRSLATDRLKLSPTDELAAAARLPLFREMAASAPLPRLADELRAAVVTEDRAAMFALAVALPARLDVAPGPLDGGKPELREARDEIRALLGEVRHRLRDASFDPVRDRANKVLTRAAEATQAIEARKRQEALDRQVSSGAKVRWPAAPTLARPS